MQKISKLGYKKYSKLTTNELDKLSVQNKNKQIEYFFIQKWLREEHHVDIIIASLLLGYKYIIYQRYPPKTIDNFVNNIFETYEEALEVGLYESLKLIQQ